MIIFVLEGLHIFLLENLLIELFEVLELLILIVLEEEVVGDDLGNLSQTKIVGKLRNTKEDGKAL